MSIQELEFEIQILEENNQNMQLEIAKSWQRIDKAIEYIKNCEIIDKDKKYPLKEEQFGEDLLNILQNGSDLPK